MTWTTQSDPQRSAAASLKPDSWYIDRSMDWGDPQRSAAASLKRGFTDGNEAVTYGDPQRSAAASLKRMGHLSGFGYRLVIRSEVLRPH